MLILNFIPYLLFLAMLFNKGGLVQLFWSDVLKLEHWAV